MKAFAAFVVVLLFPLAAFAHGMGMEATVKGGMVSISVYYDDDTPGDEAKVKVFNAAKEVVLEGKTDEKGVWAFSALPPGVYTVRAQTEDGHAAKGSFTITADPATASAPTTDAPSRADFTGARRYIMVGVGLIVLVVVFATAHWVSRLRRTAQNRAGDESTGNKL